MRNIDNVNIGNSSLDPSYPVQGKDQVHAGQSGYTSSAQNDSVMVSSEARELELYSGLIGQSRENRINQVRDMIQAGTYTVSGQSIAQNLIESNWKHSRANVIRLESAKHKALIVGNALDYEQSVRAR
jgi:anti-sigma28 factor (negative regulator of flagellin synthesis)